MKKKEDLATTASLLKRLVKERLRPHLWQYVTAFILMSIVAAATSLTAWLMKDVINKIFVEQNRGAAIWLPLIVAAIFIIKGLCGYYHEVILSKIGTRVVAGVQKRMFEHLLHMNSGYYQSAPSAQLITQLTYCANAARNMLNVAALSIGRDLLTVIGLIIVMASQDPLLFALVCVFGPVGVYGMRQISARIRNVATGEAPALAKIIEIMRETSQGIRIVKSFQLEKPILARMHSAVEALAQKLLKIRRFQARVNPLMETMAGLAIALVVAYAGWRNISNAETPGAFFAFITALLLAAEPARRLSRAQVQLTASAVGVRIMYDLLDTPRTEGTDAGCPALAITRGQISFRNVIFRYGPDESALNGLSFEAPAGKTTALVGPSGGGKTTVFNLLERFWETESGSILIDGQNIDSVSLHSLRAQVALVSQDVFLFDGTIKDNIWAGRPDASEADIIAAARAAYADQFIHLLPNGYQTSVGELGSKISGGQRQRISLARAFLKAAPIILLDEPTSALDSETEQLIQKALAELTHERTSLVIAHRLATIRNADIIHVIDEGRVTESGTHSELLKRGNLYARLYELQFAGDAVAS